MSHRIDEVIARDDENAKLRGEEEPEDGQEDSVEVDLEEE